jgi:hypothetical protein
MQTPTTKRLVAWCALSLCLLALGSGCLGTPLPDPPSFSGEGITLRDVAQIGAVRLVGDPATVNPGGLTLRVTTPPSAGVLVATNADGSFARILPGAPGDRIFFELIFPDEDRFVGAFMAPFGGRLVPVDPGPDGDDDGSPDLIDCAPTDDAIGGQRCMMTPVVCATDADCLGGQVCSAGACVAATPCRLDSDCIAPSLCVAMTCTGTGAACTPAAETCNGLDDDCNLVADEGDPGGGAACEVSPGCGGVLTCSGASLMCVPIAEICANGIDDDCDGVVDTDC